MGACNGFRYYELRHDWTYHTGPRQRIRLRECRSGVEWHGVVIPQAENCEPVTLCDTDARAIGDAVQLY